MQSKNALTFVSIIIKIYCSFAVASTDASMQMDVDEKIIFPTDGRVTSTPAPASGCHKSIFCENVADYPRQLVNAAIARNASLRFLESIDPVNNLIFKCVCVCVCYVKTENNETNIIIFDV